MHNIIFFSILTVLLYTPIGLLVNKDQLNQKLTYESLSKYLLYSLILLSIISLSVNFFYPLNKPVNTVILSIPFLVFFFNKKYFIKKEYFIFAIFVSILTFLLITKSNTYRPDAGLYHLPYISIINNEKIIFGLSNLHFRFGHVSILQYTSAIFNNYITGVNGIILAPALIFSTIIINFVSQIFNYLKKKNYNLHLFFLVSITIFIFGKMNRYSEFGNDIPAHLLLFFLLSEMLKNDFKHNYNEIKNFFILSIFVILNKISLIMVIFLPFLFITKKNLKKIFLSRKAILGTFFILIWVIKNIIVSGCAAYPIKSTCVKNISWIDNTKIEIISNETEAWAKSWPNYKKEISYNDYNKDFNWLKTWLNNNGFKTFKIIFPYIIILIFLTFLLIKKRKKIDKFPNHNFKLIQKILLILFIGFLLWFLKAPDYRYGTGYIVGFISLIFSFIIFKNKKKENLNKLILFFLLISFTVFITKNSKRIIMTDNSYNNFPWPKYYSHNNNNEYIKPDKIIINNKILYKSNSLCMYGLAPCTSNMNNFQIKKKFNYYFFIKI